MSGATACDFARVGCAQPARYLIRYEGLTVESPVCVDHTAELRANDPLEYIESVRSLPVGGTPNA